MSNEDNMTPAIRNALDLLRQHSDGRFDAEIKALETEGEKISALAEQMMEWANALEFYSSLATCKGIVAGMREVASDITGLPDPVEGVA